VGGAENAEGMELGACVGRRKFSLEGGRGTGGVREDESLARMPLRSLYLRDGARDRGGSAT
jgi:hypothetical protein